MGTTTMFSGLVPNSNAHQGYSSIQADEDDNLMGFEQANNLREVEASTVLHRAEVQAPVPVVTPAQPVVQDQCALFLDICGAVEPHENPESNEILQELMSAITRAQSELHSGITTCEDETQLVELFSLNEVIDAAFAAYHAAVERHNNPEAPTSSTPAQVEDAPVAESDVDIMDLLGGPGPSAPTTLPTLVRTASIDEFEQFFSTHSNAQEVFTPTTPKAVRVM